mmetsp:Transcript_45478/g.83228  ORF Transcript_45478/g.83228 Transcript_45478/m.83228 type:complete len:380 (+) Transcript_45478:191-1330(+)
MVKPSSVPHDPQLEVASSRSTIFTLNAVDFDSWAPVAIMASVLVLMIPGLVLYTTLWCSSRPTAVPQKLVLPSKWMGVRWLGCLAAASFVLLGLQLLLGWWADCLSLMADSAHSMADCAMYFFAFLLEFVKVRFGEVHLRSIRWMDRVSGLFSIIVVMLTSIMVTIQALMRLNTDVPLSPEKRASEVLIGPALLIFATVTLVTNMALVYAQYTWSRQAQEEEEQMVHGGSDIIDENGPLLGALGRTGAAPQKGKKLCAAYRGQRCRQAVCKDISCQDHEQKSRCAYVLHQLLHPGCSSVHHATEECEENLNLSGVNLHLLTDVVRTFLMLAAGILVVCNVVADQRRIDAACSCFVCLCVVVGSLALLASFCRKPSQALV